MRFLADMGISPNTVALLRAQGHDAVHFLEVKLERFINPAIQEKALQEERILLTHDLDFGQLLPTSKAQLASVIVLRLQNVRPEELPMSLFTISGTPARTLWAAPQGEAWKGQA